MRPRQGDIVLIPVPFTDLSSRKRRPVIVVSSSTYNSVGPDMIVVAMTSNPSPTPWSFRIESTDLEDGRLNRPGTVRVDRIYTAEADRFLQKSGLPIGSPARKSICGSTPRAGRLPIRPSGRRPSASSATASSRPCYQNWFGRGS